MGIFDGYLIYSDLDGTLTGSDGKIPKTNIDAIKHFQKNGGTFIVATGRMSDHITDKSDEFAADKYIVACNGNVLYDIENDRNVEVHTLSNDVIPVIWDAWENYKEKLLGIRYIGLNDGVVKEDNATDHINSAFKELSTGVCKVVFVTHKEEDAVTLGDYLREKYGNDYEIRRTWNTGLELWSKGAGKDIMLNRIRELLPYIHTAITVGDYENDVKMLESGDISYTPSTACESAKEAADIIGVSRDDGIIAQIVSDVERKTAK